MFTYNTLHFNKYLYIAGKVGLDESYSDQARSEKEFIPYHLRHLFPPTGLTILTQVQITRNTKLPLSEPSLTII